MLNKLYETIKKEYRYLIMLTIIVLMSVIKLPYYIDMPGGIINISKRIQIDNKELKGTMNYAYVSEAKATIPLYLFAKVNKNWDLIPLEEIVSDNETEQNAKFRDKIDLESSLSNAQYAAMKEANEKFETIDNKIYVTYISKDAKTDIKVGDQIIEIDGHKIEKKEDVKIISNYNAGTTIKIKVINNKKEQTRAAELISIDKKTAIGVSINETYNIKSNHDIKINRNARESGPSGGMMTALTIYSYITDTDLTKGKKIVGTGTIDENGNVGEIGGVKYKLIGAVKNKSDIFLVPNGENYDEAIKIKEENKYNIKIIGVSTLKEAINELKNN